MQASRKNCLIATWPGRMFLLFALAGGLAWLGRDAVETWDDGGQTWECRSACYDYLLVFPKGYAPSDPPRPLLVFLHGSGEVNGGLHDLRNANPVAYGARTLTAAEFPFLVVCPKLNDRVWEPERIVALVDEILADDRLRTGVDPGRIYLTGFSLGGYGTWETASLYPDRFAAVVPVAGACDPDWADHYGTLPIWAFHGARDRVVHPTDSVETIDAIRKRYGETDTVRLTLYPDAEHGIAATVYQEADLYRWLLRHRICGMR